MQHVVGRCTRTMSRLLIPVRCVCLLCVCVLALAVSDTQLRCLLESAERPRCREQAIMLITSHTPRRPSVQHKSTREPARRLKTHTLVHAAPSVFLSPHVVPPSSRSHCLKASDINSPFCFQERLLYILINSTPSCEINWHSFNDFFRLLWGRSFVSACRRAASEIGLNVLSSLAPGVRCSKAAAPEVNVSSSQSQLFFLWRTVGTEGVRLGLLGGFRLMIRNLVKGRSSHVSFRKGESRGSRGAVLYWPGQVGAFS